MENGDNRANVIELLSGLITKVCIKWLGLYLIHSKLQQMLVPSSLFWAPRHSEPSEVFQPEQALSKGLQSAKESSRGLHPLDYNSTSIHTPSKLYVGNKLSLGVCVQTDF